MIKRNLVRGVRKSAHLSRKFFSIGANFSGRVENKAHRIINGLDTTIKLQSHTPFEQLYYEALPYITPLHPALPRAGRAGRVNILIPTLQKSSFFGGTATALIFAAMAAEHEGKKLLITETLKKGSAKESELRLFLKNSGVSFSQKIEMNDISPRKYNNYGYIDLHPEDVLIVSAWWDAYLLEHLPLVRKFIYLIQDYEPIFYSNSDMRVLAERTYHSKKFVPVCNTEFMMQFMKSKGYDYIAKNGLYFEPAVNMSNLVRGGSRSSGKKRMFVYGRPSVERNLFYTALKSVDELFTEQRLDPNEWECFMAGQDGLTSILLEAGNEVQAMGKMSLEDYYNFAKTIDLGVSLMLAPHPSYPPLELSSLGAAVVSTKYETKQDLSRYNGNLFVCEPYVEDIKNSILRAAAISPEDRLNNAKSTNLPTEWSTILPTVKQAIKKSESFLTNF